MNDYKDQNLKSGILFWTVVVILLVTAIIVF